MKDTFNMTLSELEAELAEVEEIISSTKSPYLKRDLEKFRRHLKSRVAGKTLGRKVTA